MPTASFRTLAARPRRITQAAEAYRDRTVAEAEGPGLALHAGLRRVQEGAGRDPPAHVPRDDVGDPLRAPKRSSSTTRLGGTGRRAAAAAQRNAADAPRRPRPASRGGASEDLAFRRRRRHRSDRRGDRRLHVVLHRSADAVRPAAPARRAASSPSSSPASTSRRRSSTTSIYIDKRILDLDTPSQEVIANDQKRLVVDAFARYRVTDPLKFFQTPRLDHRAPSFASTTS